MSDRDKLRPTHLKRQAWLYIRQSSMTQVRDNVESREAQYELAARAEALGWRAEDVHVVDDDLGQSGAQVAGRSGFQSLVAAVGLGEVGLILGKEVSRLARDNATWYQLLDLCAMTDTLIADADGVYHPGDHNDRLLLGMKGTISEAELFLLRSRLNGGLHHKAAKGELRQGLPVGLDYDEDGRVVMSADEAVREAIHTVHRRFGELGSGRQVLISMVADGLAVPRRSTGERARPLGKANLPGDPRLSHQPRLRGGLCLRAQEAQAAGRRERPGGRLLRRPPDRGVGGLHPRTSPRLLRLGDLSGES